MRAGTGEPRHGGAGRYGFHDPALGRDRLPDRRSPARIID